MSIIIRGNSGEIKGEFGYGSGGTSGFGYAPGYISNLVHTPSDCKIAIKWSDPSTVYVNGVEYIDINWVGTLLVRKQGSYPKSPKDGDIVINNTEKDKYKESFFVDEGLANNTTYYYRFFTYNKDGVYNQDANNMVFYETPFGIDHVLKNNTWKVISDVAKAGNATTYWNIKDEIDVTLSGTFNETLTFQIWDFNWPKYTRTNSSGNPGIVFGSKNLMKDLQPMNNSDTSTGGWDSMLLRKTTMENIYNSMPLELRNVITPVTIGDDTGGKNAVASWSSNNKVFIPSYTEMVSLSDFYSKYYKDTNSQHFSNMFSSEDEKDPTRVKKQSNGSGAAKWYWTRTIYNVYGNSFARISNTGDCGPGMVTDEEGVCIMFCVG